MKLLPGGLGAALVLAIGFGVCSEASYWRDQVSKRDRDIRFRRQAQSASPSNPFYSTGSGDYVDPNDYDTEPGDVDDLEGSGDYYNPVIVFSRLSLLLKSKWTDALRNPLSDEFATLSIRLEQGLSLVFASADLTGNAKEPTINVLRFHPTTESEWLLVLLDLGVSNPTFQQDLRRAVENQISEGSLGGLEVRKSNPTSWWRDIGDGSSSPDIIEECGDPGQLFCKSGECIPAERRCDGITDCLDGSDEVRCSIQGCSFEQHECDFGTCMPKSVICNGVIDCPQDNSDERNCPDGNILPQPLPQPTGCRADTQIVCPDLKTRICEVQRCDGVQNCPKDPSQSPESPSWDEEDCIEYGNMTFAPPIDVLPPTTTSTTTTTTPRTTTTPATTTTTLPPDFEVLVIPEMVSVRVGDTVDFKCELKPTELLGNWVPTLTWYLASNPSTSLLADPRVTIEANGQDFQHRSLTLNDEGDYVCRAVSEDGSIAKESTGKIIIEECGSDEFTCADGKCIESWRQCNQTPDCADGEDEIKCECEGFLCTSGSNLCLSNSSVCDGIADCHGEEDEQNCECPEFTCTSDGACLSMGKVCDSNLDCADGSDERNCTCPEFTCESDGSCLPVIRVCDFKVDCEDGSDERNCPCNPYIEFACSPGDCIPYSQACDGYPHCPNGEDEVNCPSACKDNEVNCGDGTCVDSSRECDGKWDCENGNDEANCPSKCAPDQYQCQGNGNCAEPCDGIPECPDGDDERGCPPPCGPEQFFCADITRKCISNDDLCNGINDCPNGLDEDRDRCGCLAHEFGCPDGRCIASTRVCDNVWDCYDGSDERDCLPPCQPGQHQCGDGLCVDPSKICDGHYDCVDAADERDCHLCPESTYRCEAGECIPEWRRCDGNRDCSDGTDELDCPTQGCTSTQFECKSGQPLCIESWQQCNRVPDCEDGSDEQDCECRGDQFECHSGQPYCIESWQRCNQIPECADGSDERDCECTTNEFQCRSGQCIDSWHRCDGIYHCYDQSDEQNCVPKCRLGEFACENGLECIPERLRCNSIPDCRDGSDEKKCSPQGQLNLRTYPTEQTIEEGREVVFQCRDEGPMRAKVEWTRGSGLPFPRGTRDRNGRLEMPNIQLSHTGTYICSAIEHIDMAGATLSVYLRVVPSQDVAPGPPAPLRTCSPQEATCANGDCVLKSKVCDEVRDCSDGSDEMHCRYDQCEPNEFQCDNKRCVLKTWRCDSDDDCGDGSDERFCATNPPGSPCKYYEWMCASGDQCIPKSFHCDGEVDCQDQSDEIGCTPPIITVSPPPKVEVEYTFTFVINCTAMGIPTPEIIWRLNWGHVPEKCTMTSTPQAGNSAFGELTCPSADEFDQGAYSCEAINSKGSCFAGSPGCGQPGQDAILVVTENGVPMGGGEGEPGEPGGGTTSPCRPGMFNAYAQEQYECLSCFCFGVTTECSSTELYVSELSLPNNGYTIIGLSLKSDGTVAVTRRPQFDIREVLRRVASGQKLFKTGALASFFRREIPYLQLPVEGNQLRSYGGYIRFNLEFNGRGRTIDGPLLILHGNGYTLYGFVPMDTLTPGGFTNQVSVRFFTGQWFKRIGSSRTGGEEPASREEIMMALENVEYLVVKGQFYVDIVDTSVYDVRLGTTASTPSSGGQAVFVEQCLCPRGYTGISCEECAPGFERRETGQWKGECVREEISCPSGYYGDPQQGIDCQVCPCPLNTPSNQFSRDCYLDFDQQVTCLCPVGYKGRRCEQCAPGFVGDPTRRGDYCKPDAPEKPQSPSPPAEIACRGSVLFFCFDRTILCEEHLCDGVQHCPNGEDELDFCRDEPTDLPCPVEERRRCLSDNKEYCPEVACDGIDDCLDSSDEKDCPVDKPTAANNDCPRGQFRCQYGGPCLPLELVCDGAYNCRDLSDELTCVGRACSPATEFQCQKEPWTCIPQAKRCDGVPDCPDKSDEYDCPMRPSQCPTGQLACSSPSGLGFMCLDAWRWCDSVPDCPLGEDEANCQLMAIEAEFQCCDGTLIWASRQCNGYPDCPDGSDEFYCTRQAPLCQTNEFACSTGHCLPLTLRCNGIPDCPDGSDEACGCHAYCTSPGSYLCSNNQCLKDTGGGPSDSSAAFICDGIQHCADGSDEIGCKYFRAPAKVCRSFEFSCGPAGPCLPLILRCDGAPQCPGGERCNYPQGSYDQTPDPFYGCRCKPGFAGPACDITQQPPPGIPGPPSGRCPRDEFYSQAASQCVSCFCMGIPGTDSLPTPCQSSNLYRTTERAVFTDETLDFILTSLSSLDDDQLASGDEELVIADLNVDEDNEELFFDDLDAGQAYFWALPTQFTGNKLASYGGALSFKLRNEPAVNTWTHADQEQPLVEIKGNDIRLFHKPQAAALTNSTPASLHFEVPIHETAWQREDGQMADREHLLMALANLQIVNIRATLAAPGPPLDAVYISDVSMDYATATAVLPGERATAVEQCSCPPGYQGLSCEKCAPGYTRSEEGLYLGLCRPCQCYGHAGMCHPESGKCMECRDYTTGDFCDKCLDGYVGDPTRNEPCMPSSSQSNRECQCHLEGSLSSDCFSGQCQCKSGVEGLNCERCQPGYYGLGSSASAGCSACWCSGVTRECSQMQLYWSTLRMTFADSEDDHGVRMVDKSRRQDLTPELTVVDRRLSLTRTENDGSVLYWSLPPQFLGDKMTSYFGNMTIIQSYYGTGELSTEPNVILIGSNGFTMVWSSADSDGWISGQEKQYRVPMWESEWQRLAGGVPMPVEKEDFLAVLAGLEAILVKATIMEQTEETILYKVMMDIAIDQPTGFPALAIEECRCPRGYTGSSCHTCSLGYYRDPSDRSEGPLGKCKQCPCSGNEQSCSLDRVTGAIQCDCRSGYSGNRCEYTGGIQINLTPLSVPRPSPVQRRRGTLRITFTCSYRSTERHRIQFVVISDPREMPASWRKTTLQAEHGNHHGIEQHSRFTVSSSTSSRYSLGAFRHWSLNLEPWHRVVSCRVWNRAGILAGQLHASLNVEPGRGDHIEPEPRPPPPRPQPAPSEVPPIIVSVLEPRIQIREVGQTVEFRCSARSDPRLSSAIQDDVSISWGRRDGSQLAFDRILDDRQGLLVITGIRATDSGTYVCTATDGRVYIRDEAVLNVEGEADPSQPSVRIEPRYIESTAGDRAEFFCVAEGVPMPSLTWSRSDGQPLGWAAQAQGARLQFSAVSREDEGMYMCKASNDQGVAEATVILYVRGDPSVPAPAPPRPPVNPAPEPIVQIVPDDFSGAPGSEVRLTCRTNGPDYRITWSKVDGRLPYNAQTDADQLIIRSASAADSGLYVCVAVSRSGERHTSQARITIVDYRPPAEISIRPERQTVPQGSDLTLTCVVQGGSGRDNIVWTKVGVSGTTSELQEIPGGNGRTLTLRNIQIEDRGVYVCTVGETARASAIVEVERREAPKVELYPSASQKITTGQSALFQCRVVAGIPTPTLNWQRTDGRPMASLGSNVEVLEGGVLRINQARGPERGEYRCVTENIAGRAEAIATLILQEAPTVTLTPSGSIQLEQGQPLKITCLARGDPAPRVSWERLDSGGAIRSNEVARGNQVTATYEVSRVTKAQEGAYLCKASSEAGSAEDMLQIVVLEPDSEYRPDYRPPYRPPRPPYPSRPDYYPGSPGNSSTGVEVDRREFDAPLGGNAELKCFIVGNMGNIRVQWVRTDGSSLPAGYYERGGILYLKDLKRSDSGQYACEGVDPRGQVIFQAVTNLIVTAPPRVRLDPARQVVRPGDDAFISCMASGDSPIQTTWTKLGAEDRLPASVLVSGGQIQFRGISLRDQGKYVCTAMNPAGTAKATAEVIVQDDLFRITWIEAVVYKPDGELLNYPLYTYNTYTTETGPDQAQPQPQRGDTVAGAGAEYDDYEEPTTERDYPPVEPFVENTRQTFIGVKLTQQEGDQYSYSAGEYFTARVGSSIDLLCRLESPQVGNRRDFYKWWKESGYVPAKAQELDGGILRIPEVDASDGGRYYCDNGLDRQSVFLALEAYEDVEQGQTKSADQPQPVQPYNNYSPQPLKRPAVFSPGCPANQFQCRENGICIQADLVCDGEYDCTDGSDEVGCREKRDAGTLNRAFTTQRGLEIVANRDRFLIGDSVDLQCLLKGARSPVTVLWDKMNGKIAFNGEVINEVLRFTNLAEINDGYYVCRATTADGGRFEQKFKLKVEGSDTFSDESQREKLVKLDSQAELECRTTLQNPPIMYTWRKHQGVVASDTSRQGSSLVISRVQGFHAGTYICSANNSAGETQETTTLLLVSGIVPYFPQEPSSYMIMDAMKDAYLKFDIEISFKPEAANGLIFYNGQNRFGGNDFVSFGLRGGRPEFRYNLGSGTATIRGKRPITFGMWHTAKLLRNRRNGTLIIDDHPPVKGFARGRFHGLDLSTALYLGGMPSNVSVEKDTGITNGFVGCISRLIIGTTTYELSPLRTNSHGVRNCESCMKNPCQNGGVCQEEGSEHGYRCICQPGFSGEKCNREGETCYPGACNGGRCTNTAKDFQCSCPFGKSGRRCEKAQMIMRPAFKQNSFVAFHKPKHVLSELKIRFKFRATRVHDSILMYGAQASDGQGDFTAVTIKDQHVEFRFDLGSGAAIIRSKAALEANKWYEVEVERKFRNGYLSLVDLSPGGPKERAVGKSPGNTRGLNVRTHVYFGGLNHEKMTIAPGAGVESDQGFDGCIVDFYLGESSVSHLDRSVVQASNVEECPAEREAEPEKPKACTKNPCSNGATCKDQEGGQFVCICKQGYTGKTCSKVSTLCSLLQPCQNNGTCLAKPGEDFTCLCAWGFGGHVCNETFTIESPGFIGASYIELPASLLPHEAPLTSDPQLLTFNVTTEAHSGLLLWQGESQHQAVGEQDFLAVFLRNGYPVLAFDLGQGAPVEIVANSRVDDNRPHEIRAMRHGRKGSIRVDKGAEVFGKTEGLLQVLNTKSNIFVGGLEQIHRTTRGRFEYGFTGCLNSFKIGQKQIDPKRDAISTANIVPCRSLSRYSVSEMTKDLMTSLKEEMATFDEDMYLEAINRVDRGKG